MLHRSRPLESKKCLEVEHLTGLRFTQLVHTDTDRATCCAESCTQLCIELTKDVRRAPIPSTDSTAVTTDLLILPTGYRTHGTAVRTVMRK